MATHQDQPVFHLHDRHGWVNDPNGPLYHKGQYHMFFQTVTDSTKWTWGLSWGHATSTDLLHWRQLPPALSPEPDWHDADGCFSGCATIDTHGRPAILYTGVKKKPDAGEREGMPLTVNKLCFERQLIARPANPDDLDLTEWVKVREPFLWHDMSHLPVNCFRDPFVLERPCEANGFTWRVMVGSNIQVTPEDWAAAAGLESDDASSSSSSSSAAGVEGSGAVSAQVSSGGQAGGADLTLGTATVYRSLTEELEGGWVYEGLLCVARPGEGALWECPIMVPLTLPAQPAEPAPVAATTANTTAATAGQAVGAIGQAAGQASEASAATGLMTATAAAAAPPPHPSQTSAALTGAVAAIAATQQQQQQEAAERAMSGLWSPVAGSRSTTTGSSSSTSQPLPITGSGTGSTRAAHTPSSISSSFKDWTLSPNNSFTASSQQPQSPHSPQHQEAQQDVDGVPPAPTHLFSVSAGVCPAIYWLGRYAEGRFDLDAADGPHALDLGDVLYAPNLMEDEQGRQLIWSWLQEQPSPLSHDYAGCISLPRQLQLGVKKRKVSRQHLVLPSEYDTMPANINSSQLHQQLPRHPLVSAAAQHMGPAGMADTTTPHGAAAVAGDAADGCEGEGEVEVEEVTEYFLVQTPLPELAQLRSGRGLRLRGIRLPANKAWSVPSQVSASHLDLSLIITPTPGAQRFQVLLGPLRQDGDQQQQQQQQQPTSNPTTAVADPGATAAASTLSPVGMPGGLPDSPSSAAPQSFVPLAAPPPPTAAATTQPSAASTISAASNMITTQSLLLGPPHTLAGGSANFNTNSSHMLPAFQVLQQHSAEFNPAATTPQDPAESPTAVGASFHSPVGSPGSQDMPTVLPLLPGMLLGGPAAANPAAAAAAAAGAVGGGTAEAAAPLGPVFSPEAAQAAAAAAAASSSVIIDTQAAEDASALAAAAAAELTAPDHHQAAAITYEFGSSQLQVLVGPPAAVLKLLKQQQEELLAASAPAAPAAASAASTAGASGQQQSSRTGTPTEEALGFAPPMLPPAPSGKLAASLVAAEAAGVRVLSCQLRLLDADEPLQLRLLLDYSILELFVGTGEALTTRCYRGMPTARAAEVAARRAVMRRSVELASEEEQVSMSGSLANLGLLLHQHTTAASSPAASPLHPSHSAPAAAAVAGSGELGPGANLSGNVSPRSPAGLSAPTGLVGSLGSPAAGRSGSGSRWGWGQSWLGRHSTPFSPGAISSSSFVHYFSPHRSFGAHVPGGSGSGRHVATQHLPTLEGILEVPSVDSPAALAEVPASRDAAAAAAAMLLTAHNHTTTTSTGGSSSTRTSAAVPVSSSSSSFAEQQGRAAGEAEVTADPSSPPAGSSSGLFSTRSAPVSPFAAASREYSSRIEAFPGFSPHRPPVTGSSSSSSSGGLPSAHSAGARLASWFQKVSSRAAGRATDASQGFTGRRRSSSSIGSSSSSIGSSASSAGDGGTQRARCQAVVPPTFGVPVLPLHLMQQQQQVQQQVQQPQVEQSGTGKLVAPIIGGYRADSGTAGGSVADVQQVHDQPLRHPHQALAVLAPPRTTAAGAGGDATGDTPSRSSIDKTSDQSLLSAFVNPKLSIKTSSSTSASHSKPVLLAVRQQQQLQQAATTAEVTPSAVASSNAATSSSTIATTTTAGGGTNMQSALQQLPRFPALRDGGSQSSSGVNSPSSARSEGGGGAAASLRHSPRRNWRSAFVFSEEEEEEEQGAGGPRQEGTTAAASDVIMRDLHKLLTLPPNGPAGAGGAGSGLLLPVPPSPAEAAFGLYAKVLAPPAGSNTTSKQLAAAGAPAGDEAAVPPAGGDAVAGAGAAAPADTAAAAAPAAGVSPGCVLGSGSSSSRQSGYVAGAMRELSLVALGGDGVVVQRLEAYEMSNMWDDDEQQQQHQGLMAQG